MIDKSREYHQGYAEGYRNGWFKACEGLDKLVATLQNPPPIVLQGVEVAALSTIGAQPPQADNTGSPKLVCPECGGNGAGA